MDYSHFLERIDLAPEGRETFFALHERMARADFADSVRAARAAFDAGDEAFGAEITAFAEREEIQVELLNLYLYICFSAEVFDDYRRRGISDDIFYDTFFDITAGCRKGVQTSGVYGVPQKIHREWFRRHLAGLIYRLGRLQFELIESAYDLPEYGLKKGDVCLSTHIPGYTRLDDAAAEAAYAAARVFFREKYGMEKCVFFCHSWLLHPWLREDLPPESLIRIFSEKYRLLDVTESRATVMNWVFPGMEDADIADLPRDNSLRRAAVARMEEGRPLGYALGVRI